MQTVTDGGETKEFIVVVVVVAPRTSCTLVPESECLEATWTRCTTDAAHKH